jgi:hypothetical protein
MITVRGMVGLRQLSFSAVTRTHSVISVYVWETMSELPDCVAHSSMGQAADEGSRVLTAMQCITVDW